MPADRRLFRLLANVRRRTRMTVALAGAAALVSVAWPAGASALPPEGIFDSCQLDTQMSTCLQRLQTIHSGGFQVVVINAYSASLTSLETYADAAHSMGMSVMWELSSGGWWNSPLSSSAQDYGGWIPFATACGCSQDGQILSFMIHWLAALPGTYGYYAADDSMLSPGDKSGVSNYVAAIKAADPVHPVVLSSSYEGETAQYESVGDMNAAEMYPIMTSTLMPVSKNQDWWGAESQTASYDQKLANRAGKASAFILQAFTWGDNLSDGEAVGICTPSMSQQQCWDAAVYPTAADELQLRNEVLKHADPGIILWWSFPGTYGQAGGDTYSLYPTGSAAAAHWAGLVNAINAPAPAGYLSHSTRKKHHKRHHHRKHHKRHHHRKHRGHHRTYQLRHPRRLI
jgi:hypothetical protein